MKRLLGWLTGPYQVRRVFESIFGRLGLRNSEGAATPLQARRILVVRPDKLGDLLLTIPFLAQLRGNCPAAEITLLVAPDAYPLVEHCPYVDHVEIYRRWRPCVLGQIRRFVHEVKWARSHFWPRHFDLAIVPRWDNRLFREDFLAYLSGAKWRACLCQRESVMEQSEPDWEALYTHIAPCVPSSHEVQKSFDLLTSLGATIVDARPELRVDPAGHQSAAALLPESAGGERPIRVAMTAGSASPGRLWPAERFGALAAWMISELGWEVVLVGSPAETEVAAVVERCCSWGVVNLAGRTSLCETVAVIERCDIYVGNDTGPMHMAAAVGLPVVEISCHPVDGLPSHERSPSRFGAWDVPTWVARPAKGLDDCRDFCVPGEIGETHCVQAVTLEQVQELVLKAADRCQLIIRDARSAAD